MKIVFITDYASIHEDNQTCIKLYSMVKDCILQILIYLKQSASSCSIEVGFKFCDSRSHFEINNKHQMKDKRTFHLFTNCQDILRYFSDEYKETKRHRIKRTQKPKQILTPIISTSRSRSSYSRSSPSTPNITSTTYYSHSVHDHSPLGRINTAISQSAIQFQWSTTLLNPNDDNDNIEPQMIFILSTIPNDGFTETLQNRWKNNLRDLYSKKSVNVQFIHIPKPFNSSNLPSADDETEEKYINAMDSFLRQSSYGSFGVIPLTLLWMAPHFKIQQQLQQFFKINQTRKNKNVSTFWTKFLNHKLYEETVRWNGKLCISKNMRNNNSNRNKRNIRSSSDQQHVLCECQLISIECVKWNRYTVNNHNHHKMMGFDDKFYDILKNENNENLIDCMMIDGFLDESQFQKMSHLPYISLIIRRISNNITVEKDNKNKPRNTKSTESTNQATNEENYISFQQIEQLFLSTTYTKYSNKYFTVKFKNCDENIKAVMYCIKPPLIS